MNQTVKIYSTPHCVYCKMAKEYFTKRGIAYTEMDVSENEGALQTMIAKSHQMGVPVIEVGEEVIVGFNRMEIDRLLEAAAA